MTLRTLTEQYSSLSIVGLCKNAGKTTALNRLIREYNALGRPLALTSIGRDGETRDVVTDTPKPKIYIYRDTLLATAEGLLPCCDITREIVLKTSVGTPLGNVIILKALSDGFVQLAGPSMNDQLKELMNTFRSLGADKIIIDGAVSRRSLCSCEVTDAAVLCAGASCHRDMDKVIGETVHVCDILSLPPVNGVSIPTAGESAGERLLYLTEDGSAVSPGKEQSPDPASLLRSRPDIRWLFVNGAVTDSLVAPLAALSEAPPELSVVAKDGSRVLLSRPVLERLRRRGWRLMVQNPVQLAAVAVNPVSAYGYAFNKTEFMEKMARAVSVPVFDAEDDLDDKAEL